MRAASLVLAVSLCAASAQAAQDPLAALNDEFDGPALSSAWTRFDQAFGWPDKVKRLSVENGAVTLEPYHSAWVRDLNAPFLFKTLQGDFDVRARVRVRGLNGPVPGGTWSLGGLMARQPTRTSASAWEPRRENWNFVTTGVGHLAGRTMTETKSTYNSTSNLKLRPFESGWVELRLVRVGMSMFALARSTPEGPWLLRDRWYRMEARPEVQVGLIAYTTSDDVPPGPENPEAINRAVDTSAKVDMALDVDWIRFSRPRAPSAGDWYAEVSGGNVLSDPNLPEAEVLRLLGA